MAARAAASKGGEDLLLLEVGQVIAICDVFVLASGRNHRQVKTIADEVEEHVRQAGGGSPLRVEGKEQAEWLVLDYGGLVVHVFLDETRRYYELERLWSDVPRLEWEDAGSRQG